MTQEQKREKIREGCGDSWGLTADEVIEFMGKGDQNEPNGRSE